MIIHDDIVHKDSKDTANMFNDYFVDLQKNIAESIGGIIIIIFITLLI